MGDKLRIDIIVYDDQCYIEFNMYKEIHTLPIEDVWLILRRLDSYIDESNSTVRVDTLTCRGGSYRSLEMGIREAATLREGLISIFGGIDE